MDLQNKSVPFWPEQKIAAYDSELPLLIKIGKVYLDSNWPSNGASQDDVFAQLRKIDRVWVSSYQPKDKDGVILTFLVGKYKITANVGTSNDKPRLWLSRIYYANNQDQLRMLQNGALASVKGLFLISGPEFGNGLERSDFKFSSGSYVSQLLEIIASPWSVNGEKVEPEESIDELDYKERELVDALRSFVDAEYSLEQIAAQQCSPFSAVSITALSRKTSYRLHYEMVIDESDYERLCELKPSLLVQLSDTYEPTDILFEITDLAPVEKQPIIHVSIEKQVEHSSIPDKVMLGLAAMPTLKHVREAVIDALAENETKNPWLLQVAAEIYQPTSISPVEVPLPPSKFPPTASQVKAINSGAGSHDYTLVLGPPGTGKTTVILQWVKYFAAQGLRVLVTSQNNKAVDNVLERLAEEDEFECLRIGNENKISSSLEDITLDNKAAKLQKELFSNADHILLRLSNLYESMQQLLAQKDIILAKITQRDEARSVYSEIFSDIGNLRNKLLELSSNLIGYDEEQHLLTTKLNEIKQPKWFMMQFVADWMYKKKVSSFNHRLEKNKTKIAAVYQAIELNKKTTEDKEKLRLSISQQIIELESEVAQWQQELDCVVPQFSLKSDTHELNVQSIAKLESTIGKVEIVQTELAQWFEKLRNERQQVLYKILMERVNVVGATCIGINTKPLFRQLDFDVVIVDESGQIQLHNLMVPLSRAKKAILVGDHKQLPPVVSDEVLDEIEAQGFEDYKDLYRLSWFEHLWNASPGDRKIMLDTQFRCPSIISDFVSEAFYEGKYFAGAGMDKKKPLLSFCPQPMIWLDTCRAKDKKEQSAMQDGRAVVLENRCETKLVIEVLERSIKEKPELATDREIGIIVPYANHVKAIQKAIKKEQKRGRLTELTMPLNELVASVDSFQGQERDLIIFTFTRSNRNGKVGFLSDWRRLNVAQTRAKKQLVMIGDSQTLTNGFNREGAHDLEFKQAMFLLRDSLYRVGALLDAEKALGLAKKIKSTKNTPSNNKRLNTEAVTNG